MRILVYPHSMELGGSQLNAVELAGAAVRRGHEVTVLGEAGPLVDRLAPLEVEHVEVTRSRLRPSPAVLAQLCGLVRDRDVAVVHGYEWPPVVEAVYGPGLRLGTPVVGTVMSMSVAPFIPRGTPLTVGTADILAAERARRPGVTLLEPPVDTDANRPGDRDEHRAAFGLGRDDFVVVVVSRLAVELKREGILAAVRAAGMLADELPVRLVVVGDGPCRDEVQAAASEVNRVAGREVVLLTGGLRDPRPAYQSSDVCLGMGGSALRAAAFGVPLVVLGEQGFARLLDASSLPSFLAQGWFGLGHGGDAAPVLAALLRRLHAEPGTRSAAGALALATVTERFSLARAAEQQEARYRDAVASRQPRHRRAPGLLFPLAHVLCYDAARKVRRRCGAATTDDFNARPARAR